MFLNTFYFIVKIYSANSKKSKYKRIGGHLNKKIIDGFGEIN